MITLPKPIVEESFEERLNRVFNKAINLYNEGNTNRIDWEQHEMNSNFVFTDKSKFTNQYYLLNIYEFLLSEEQSSAIYRMAEGHFHKSYFNWVEGRCSLEVLTTRGPEYYEEKLESIEKRLDEAIIVRDNHLRQYGSRVEKTDISGH